MYDSLRLAELRAHLWVFATRRTVLYPVAMSTMTLVPPVWNTSEIYPFAAVVSYNGRIYSSTVNANQGSVPEHGTGNWDIFVGSTNVNQWGIFPGLTPPANPWSSVTTYPGNAFVTYNGNLYVSNQNSNLNHQPDISPAWWMYEGAVQIQPSSGYFTGDLVYYPAGSAYQIFLSLQNNNNVQPGGGLSAWNPLTTYNPGDQVSYSSAAYESNLPLNLDNTPEATPDLWLTASTYNTSDTVVFYDGQKYNIYTSAVDGNIGNPPLLDGEVNTAFWAYTSTPQWISVLSQELASSQEAWLLLADSTLEPLRFNYPIGTGPLENESNKNVFILPYGYLREAPQDPKGGFFSPLGAPTSRPIDDWVFENGMFISFFPGPGVVRVCADVTNPYAYDALFREGLRARLAEELAEHLTHSSAKKQVAQADYKQYMGQATRTNAIESQPTDFPLDDWIAARI